jgi:hypothetical protein
MDDWADVMQRGAGFKTLAMRLEGSPSSILMGALDLALALALALLELFLASLFLGLESGWGAVAGE